MSPLQPETAPPAHQVESELLNTTPGSRASLCCPQGSTPLALCMDRIPASCHSLDTCAHIAPHHCAGCLQDGRPSPRLPTKAMVPGPSHAPSPLTVLALCPGTGGGAQTEFLLSRTPHTWSHLLSADEEPMLCPPGQPHTAPEPGFIQFPLHNCLLPHSTCSTVDPALIPMPQADTASPAPEVLIWSVPPSMSLQRVQSGPQAQAGNVYG